MHNQPTVAQMVRDASRQEPDSQVRRFDFRLPVFRPHDTNRLRELLRAFNA
jgi:hypothetical protein